jgi:membrane protease YdiL (CAAX protease family)
MSDAPPPEPLPSAAAAPPPPPGGRAAWPPWLAAVAFLAGFGVTIVLGLMVFVVATAAGVSDGAPGISIGLTIVQNVALVGAAFFFASMSRGRVAAADFGLRPAPFWRSVALLVAVWVGFLVLSAIWAAALQLDQQQDLPEELGADGPLLNVLAVVVLVTVVAPLGEELFFRGFFFGALRNWRGPWLAALITGIVFGGIHLGSSPAGYLVPLMILGAGLCLLYEWTGSLYPAIALHALNNSIALGANLKWDWQIPVMMVGSTAAALLCAWLLARVVGDGARPPATSAPAPGTA